MYARRALARSRPSSHEISRIGEGVIASMRLLHVTASLEDENDNSTRTQRSQLAAAEITSVSPKSKGIDARGLAAAPPPFRISRVMMGEGRPRSPSSGPPRVQYSSPRSDNRGARPNNLDRTLLGFPDRRRGGSRGGQRDGGRGGGGRGGRGGSMRAPGPGSDRGPGGFRTGQKFEVGFEDFEDEFGDEDGEDEEFRGLWDDSPETKKEWERMFLKKELEIEEKVNGKQEKVIGKDGKEKKRAPIEETYTLTEWREHCAVKYGVTTPYIPPQTQSLYSELQAWLPSLPTTTMSKRRTIKQRMEDVAGGDIRAAEDLLERFGKAAGPDAKGEAKGEAKLVTFRNEDERKEVWRRSFATLPEQEVDSVTATLVGGKYQSFRSTEAGEPALVAVHNLMMMNNSYSGKDKAALGQKVAELVNSK